MVEKFENLDECVNVINIVVTSGPHEGTFFPISAFPCVIGRGLDTHVPLTDDAFVSTRHCELTREGNVYQLRDLDSSNGTFVNGTRIFEPHQIIPLKSTIMLGQSQLLVEAFDEEVKEDRLGLSKTFALENMLSENSIIVPNMTFFTKQEQEESLFVVDICDSTILANRHGEKELLKVLHLTAKSISHHSERNDVLFMKCTGDGFFAAFKNTHQALRVGCCLLRDMERLSEVMPNFRNPGLRVAIHRGSVSTDKSGDRLGIACHLLFRIEGTKLKDMVAAPDVPIDFPDRNRILLTPQALDSLGGELAGCFAHVGEFKVKGFEEPVSINILLENRRVMLQKLR